MIRGVAISTRGRIKLVNDDKVVLNGCAICAGVNAAEIEAPAFAAVFDGVSQGGRGSEASTIASTLVIEHFCSNDCEVGKKDIESLLADINETLISHQRETAPEPIATTISGIAISANSKVIGFNSGDSRVYRYRNGMLVQMTTDHTVIQSLVDAGADDSLIEQAEATDAHAITKALGIKATDGIVADIEDFGEFLDGDVFIGCTDGLSGFLTREDMKRVLSAEVSSIVAARTLVDMALHNGSHDNISIFVLARSTSTDSEIVVE